MSFPSIHVLSFYQDSLKTEESKIIEELSRKKITPDQAYNKIVKKELSYLDKEAHKKFKDGIMRDFLIPVYKMK